MQILKDKKFVKLVENFVFTNDKKFIKDIVKYKSKIPSTFSSSTKPLFRGMILSKEAVQMFDQGGKLTFDDFSSWTTIEKIAIQFVRDPKKRLYNKEGDIGVILKKKIPNAKIILNIQSLFLLIDSMGMADEFDIDELNLEMGIKEGEFICDKGVTIKKADIKQRIKI